MLRGVGLSLCLLAAASVASAGQVPAAPAAVPPAESRLQFYGLVRQDLIYDDSRADAAQTPLVILSEPAGSKNRENFTMHPRLSRLGLNITGPQLEGTRGARIAGKIEFDFQNGGRESRAIPRYRHAYLTLTWTRAAVLVGQTADVISPLLPTVNGDTAMWHAGNLGDRRPQVRTTFTSVGRRTQISVAAAIGLTGAVDQQDLDDNGVRDGEAAGAPQLQGRVGVSRPIGKRRLLAGAWAFAARQTTTAAIAGRTKFPGHAVGLDVEAPLGARGIVRGEMWTGASLADVRGGIGQSVNRSTGAAVHSRGGWVEAGMDVTSRYALFGGYTIDAPDGADIPAGGRTRNSAWYIVNRWSAGRPFVVGLDCLRWTTEYLGAAAGLDHRFNAYVVYTF